MKAAALLFGILLLVGGLYFVFDGYQIKQTTTAVVENEISTAIKALTNNSIASNSKINNEGNIKLIGGGIAAATGVVLIILGLRSKSKP